MILPVEFWAQVELMVMVCMLNMQIVYCSDIGYVSQWRELCHIGGLLVDIMRLMPGKMVFLDLVK
jgi:hypothetical protein